MNAKVFNVAILCTIATLIQCTTQNDEVVDDSQLNTDVPAIPDDQGTDEDDETFVPNTQPIHYDNAVSILFDGDNVTVINPFDGKGVTVSNSKAHVTLTSKLNDTEVNYVIAGITDNGSVKIYGEYKLTIVLNGTSITNPTGPALNIQCPKQITVTLVDLTNNKLADGTTYNTPNNEDAKATLFAEGQLLFYGNGKLDVSGNYKHAICTDDYLHIHQGNVNVKNAVSDGLHADEQILVAGGTITVRSTGDGIDSEKGDVTIEGGTIQVTTTGQKGHAIKANTSVDINTNDNNITLTTYGTAAKGISANENVVITKGNININTAGDAIYESTDNDITSAAGVKCDKDFIMENGTLTVLSTGTGGKGISADGNITINNGTLNVTTTGELYTKDRNNTTAAKAIKADGNLTVNNGNVIVKTYGTEAEGLESKNTLTIKNGNIEIEAYDDCINAAKHIQIDGGNIYCNSTTNDGVDSNGTITITGGTTISTGATQPEEGFDCDRNKFLINGGTVIGTGGATSTPTANGSTQCSVVYATSTTPDILHVTDANNKQVITFKMPDGKNYGRQVTILFSSPQLQANTDYVIYSAGTITDGTQFHGLYSDATCTATIQAATFKTNSIVTNVGSAQGGIGGGQGQGQGGFPGGW